MRCVTDGRGSLMKRLRQHSRHIGQIASLACYIVVGYILFRYFQDIEWSKLQRAHINSGALGIACVAEFGTRLILPVIWVFLLREFGQHIRDYWLMNAVYAKAWLGRYLPGKVAWVGGKIYFASKEGLDVTILTLTSPLESVIQIIANLMVGLGFMMLFSPAALDRSMLAFAAASLAVLMGCTYPPLFNRLVRFAYKLLRKRELDAKYSLRLSTFWKTFLLFVGFSVASGVPFSLTCRAVVPEFDVMRHFLYIVGASTLSGAIGMLALFAPGGFGVREGVLAVFFAPLFSRESALLVVILLRLLAVIGDLLFFAVSRAIVWLRARPARLQKS